MMGYGVSLLPLPTSPASRSRSRKSLTIDTQAPVTTITSLSTGAWVSTTALSVTGVASDGSGTGVSKVYVKADGALCRPPARPTTAPRIPRSVGTAGPWPPARRTGPPPSPFRARVARPYGSRPSTWRATSRPPLARSPPESTSAWIFNPPTLGSTDAVGNLVKAGFTLTGTISDSNPASIAGTTLNLAVTVDGGSSTPIVLGSGSWTYPFTVDAATHAQDGTHTFVFTGTDVAAKTTTLTRTVSVDTRGPPPRSPTRAITRLPRHRIGFPGPPPLSADRPSTWEPAPPAWPRSITRSILRA